jgi:OOP family OmpA-OmpF porin
LIEDYGIPASRLSAQGFGKSRPVASNSTDLGRAMNRRVTLVNTGTGN